MTSPKTLLSAWNIRAKKKLGQHFLSDPSTAQMIVARSKISPDDIVLEIGAGLGALTIPLAQAAASVYAVEKDQRIHGLLKAELLVKKVSNVTRLRASITRMRESAVQYFFPGYHSTDSFQKLCNPGHFNVSKRACPTTYRATRD
jgi:16S rRNA (adenine1518-N6/adenine1519-N6)-dimethyltransferase